MGKLWSCSSRFSRRRRWEGGILSLEEIFGSKCVSGLQVLNVKIIHTIVYCMACNTVYVVREIFMLWLCLVTEALQQNGGPGSSAYSWQLQVYRQSCHLCKRVIIVLSKIYYIYKQNCVLSLNLCSYKDLLIFCLQTEQPGCVDSWWESWRWVCLLVNEFSACFLGSVLIYW